MSITSVNTITENHNTSLSSNYSNDKIKLYIDNYQTNSVSTFENNPQIEYENISNSTITNNLESSTEEEKSWWDNFMDNWHHGIEVIGGSLGKTKTFQTLNQTGIVDVVKNIEATKGNILTGVGKGIFNAVEGVFDFGTNLVGIAATPFTGLLDAFAYSIGQEWNVTNRLWNDGIQKIVGCKVVDSVYSAYYDDYGKVMNDNTIDFFKTDGMGYQISEMVGTVLATLAGGEALGNTGVFGEFAGMTSTAGKLSASTIAGMTGFGQGTEDAWNDGANTLTGLGFGALTGLLDFSQYMIGGVINNVTVGGGSSIWSKLGTIGLRALLDGVDNAAEGFIRPAYKSLYNGKLFDENFNEAGGWSNVLTQFLIGSAISAESETIEMAVSKTLKKISTNGEISQVNLSENDEYKPKAIFAGHQKNTFSSNRNYDFIIDSVIRDHDKYCTRFQTINRLRNYAETGYLNFILDENFCRENISQVPLNEIKKYLDNYEIFHRSNFTSSDLYDDIIDKVITFMDNKYGSGVGIKQIEGFVSKRDINYISRAVRGDITNVPFNEVQQYLKNYQLNQDIMNGKLNCYNRFFDSLFKNGDDYGVDQAVIEKLCDYKLDGQNFSYRGAMEMVNNSLESGNTAPLFQKIGSRNYFKLKDKLISYGFTNQDASVILSSINDAGACSYASVCGDIFDSFSSNPNAFKQIFGFDMYINDRGVNKLNSSELLLDLFIYANDEANGGRLFRKNEFSNGYSLFNQTERIDVFGRKMLNTDEQMIYMSNTQNKNTKFIDGYLKTKNRNLIYTSNSFAILDKTGGIVERTRFNDIVKNVHDDLMQGKSISIDVVYDPNKIGIDTPFRFIDADNGTIISTLNWNEGGAHSVKVTGLTNDSFIVSTWGRKYYMPFNDFLDGGRATFYSIGIGFSG